jgi:hypothetical protein
MLHPVDPKLAAYITFCKDIEIFAIVSGTIITQV